MGFVTPALLAGTLLVGLPIILHLIMRREPQHILFPALRFVRQRRALNQHRLQLRHLLLLALRAAIIAALAVALARPTLRGTGLLGKEAAPIAAALVFDNSVRMEYVQENQTHLARAQELATWLVDQLPVDIPLAVVELSPGYRSFSPDHDAARLRIERLHASPAAGSLEDAMAEAVKLLRQQEGYRGELYVFTDLSVHAWSDEMLTQFREEWSTLTDANLYLVDVGAELPRNKSLGDLRLSGETVVEGSPVAVETPVQLIGNNENAPDVLVELFLEANGKSQKRDQQNVSPSQAQPAQVRFSLAGLKVGVHQGYVRLASDDPLPVDNTRYFTVEVKPPSHMLIVAEAPENAVFLREAIAPSVPIGSQRPAFECRVTTFSKVKDVAWSDFDAVCLLDPPPLAADTWQSLVDYVRSGHGLGIFLGRNAQRESFGGAAPQEILPGQLLRQSRDATYLRPTIVHPIFSELKEFAELVPWATFPVYKYWEFEAWDEDSNLIASFANGRPAIVEQQIGEGRVLLATTPISDPAHREPWNVLPTQSDPWPFLALSMGLAQYLTGTDTDQLNYFAGQSAVIGLSSIPGFSSYVLQIPGTAALRQAIPPGETKLAISTTDAIGNYRLLAGGAEQSFDRGFSVNCPAAVTQLERITFAKIVDVLGRDRVQLARSTQELERRVGIGRVGRELFPLLVTILALVLGAEHILANRFYRRS